MPTITRWFHVTHDINGDPEMWELREKFGDRAGFVWLECLSIADRNSGLVGTDSPQLRNILATKCRMRPATVGQIINWCLAKGWLDASKPLANDLLAASQPLANHLPASLRVAKWAKYNKTRETKQFPSYPNLSSPLLSYSSKKKNKKIAPSHRNVTPPTPWPSEDVWLSELLKKQPFCSHCAEQLQDYEWWELAAKSLGGIDRAFIEKEFAKIGAWWRENPTKRKTANGMKRFLRTWLEKAKNDQGRLYAVKR